MTEIASPKPVVAVSSPKTDGASPAVDGSDVISKMERALRIQHTERTRDPNNNSNWIGAQRVAHLSSPISHTDIRSASASTGPGRHQEAITRLQGVIDLLQHSATDVFIDSKHAHRTEVSRPLPTPPEEQRPLPPLTGAAPQSATAAKAKMPLQVMVPCPGCDVKVVSMERFTIIGPGGLRWHIRCLRCAAGVSTGNRGGQGCGKLLDASAVTNASGRLSCRNCLVSIAPVKAMLLKGTDKPTAADYLTMVPRFTHNESSPVADLLQCMQIVSYIVGRELMSIHTQ